MSSSEPFEGPKQLVKVLDEEIERRERGIDDYKNDSTSVFSRQRVEKLRTELSKNIEAHELEQFRLAYKLSRPLHDLELELARFAENDGADKRFLVRKKQLESVKRDIINAQSQIVNRDDLSEVIDCEKKKISYIIEKLVKGKKLCDKFKATLFSLIRAFEHKNDSYLLVKDLHLESVLKLRHMKLVEFDENCGRVRLINGRPKDDEDENNDSFT